MNLKCHIKKIKTLLIFFSFLTIIYSCKKESKVSLVTVNYENNNAVSISLDSKWANNLQVFLEDNSKIPVFGSSTTFGQIVNFQPIIPFSSGKTYNVYFDKKFISKFSIKERKNYNPTEVQAVYPSTDSIPENLLKMYVLFSNPMMEVGSSLDFIKVIDTKTNEEVEIFLPLQTELWNSEHTLLTLWLDPGRIKRDLIPNIESGLPIENGKQYTLFIDSSWKDANGYKLDSSYQRNFNVLERDKDRPSVDDWELTISSDHLIMDFDEALDIVLAEDAILVKDSNNDIIFGDYLFMNNGHSLKFTPNVVFASGHYSIVIESRLEDLAGNNLNRLFDKDLTDQAIDDNSEIKILNFEIH